MAFLGSLEKYVCLVTFYQNMFIEPEQNTIYLNWSNKHHVTKSSRLSKNVIPNQLKIIQQSNKMTLSHNSFELLIHSYWLQVCSALGDEWVCNCSALCCSLKDIKFTLDTTRIFRQSIYASMFSSCNSEHEIVVENSEVVGM